MTKKACTDEELIALVQAHGCTGAARILGIGVRTVNTRRARLEKQNGIMIVPPKQPGIPDSTRHSDYPYRVPLKIENGVVLIGSDAHFWPGIISTATRGLIYCANELKPKALILNGDVFDGAETGRHPPIMWSHPPTTNEELQAVDERLDEIRNSAKGAELFWTIGNHDARFESRLSKDAPQYRGVAGTRLKDHFPHWQICWSIWVNDLVVVKHRFKGGVHATHNNTVNAGKTMVTGHLHSLKVTPFSDYNGTRWGVDTGTMADPYGPQFEYAEDNPLNHRSGFAVLTFHNGKLLWPELASVVDAEHIQFRGQIIKV